MVPVLNRPHRVAPLLRSVFAHTPDPAVLFVISPGDRREAAAIRREGGRFITYDGNYAQKIRAGIEATDEPLVFLGADDLAPHPGWFEAAWACMSNWVAVVGVNDTLVRRREHATHFLMTREYASQPTIDGGPGPMHDGYSHWCVDDELIATARRRGVYAYCAASVVQHLHPMADTAPMDSTYERGQANRHADMALFRRRRRLWT